MVTPFPFARARAFLFFVVYSHGHLCGLCGFLTNSRVGRPAVAVVAYWVDRLRKQNRHGLIRRAAAKRRRRSDGFLESIRIGIFPNGSISYLASICVARALRLIGARLLNRIWIAMRNQRKSQEKISEALHTLVDELAAPFLVAMIDPERKVEIYEAMLTKSQVAKILDVSVRTIDRLRKSGQLPAREVLGQPRWERKVVKNFKSTE